MASLLRPPPASFVDLARYPDDLRLEIVHGTIVEKASPTGEHGTAQWRLGSWLSRRFDRRGPGGPGPGGWWLASEVDVEYQTSELYRHGGAGWRRDRVPVRPSGRPVRDRPDWVAEILSASNAKRDLVDKFLVLQAAGVPHYWILDPEDKKLIVYRLEPSGYSMALSAGAGDVALAEPFHAIPLKVAILFGDEDDD